MSQGVANTRIYELIEPTIKDTVTVRETYSFRGKTYPADKMGIQNYADTIKTGVCDTVYNLDLYVMPDPSVKEYYVKVNAEGNGTGSSWENAMSGEDFAYVLPKASENTTFYIAEGSYSPIYSDDQGTMFTETGGIYYVNTSVKLIGGYPKDAVDGAVSDPEKYHTTRWRN